MELFLINCNYFVTLKYSVKQACKGVTDKINEEMYFTLLLNLQCPVPVPRGPSFKNYWSGIVAHTWEAEARGLSEPGSWRAA